MDFYAEVMNFFWLSPLTLNPFPHLGLMTHSIEEGFGRSLLSLSKPSPPHPIEIALRFKEPALHALQAFPIRLALQAIFKISLDFLAPL